MCVLHVCDLTSVPREYQQVTRCNLVKWIFLSCTSCLFFELVSYRNGSHVLQSIRLLFYQVEKNTLLNIISRCCYVVVNVVL